MDNLHYFVLLLSLKPARTRKLSETSAQSVSTLYRERKANHKAKFKEMGDEIPERTKLTMFDLIYYNPTDGKKMSNPATRKSSRMPSPERNDAQCKNFAIFYSLIMINDPD